MVEKLKLDYENIPARYRPSDILSWLKTMQPRRNVVLAKHLSDLSRDHEQIIIYAYTEK